MQKTCVRFLNRKKEKNSEKEGMYVTGKREGRSPSCAGKRCTLGVDAWERGGRNSYRLERKKGRGSNGDLIFSVRGGRAAAIYIAGR